MIGRKLFVSSPSINPSSNRSSQSKDSSPRLQVSRNPVMSSKASKSGDGPDVIGTIQQGYGVWKSLPEGAKSVVTGAARDFINKRGVARTTSAGYALSYDVPDPRHVALDSGITPQTYSNDWMVPEEGKCTTMHLSASIFQIPSSASQKLFDYFNSVISFDIQVKAQAAVSFNLNVNTDLSAANILTAFNSLAKALQIYFFYQGIVSYQDCPSNNNEGMNYLRRLITPQMLEDLAVLERRLLDTPVPPHLYEIIRYLSAVYSSGESQGSPLLKICPHALVAGSIVDTSAISGAMTLLTNPTNNIVFTLLRRAVPYWTPTSLNPAPIETLYDPNFLTLFANLPYTYYDTAIRRVPSAALSSDTISYNSYTNRLDGVIYGLNSIYDTTNSVWAPGLMTPPAGNGTSTTENSRRSYYAISGTSTFYIVKDSPYLVKSRQETYYNDSTTTTAQCHLHGAEKCLNVNMDSIRQTAQKTLDFLMSAPSILPKANTGFNKNSSMNKSSGSRNSRNRNSKSKS